MLLIALLPIDFMWAEGNTDKSHCLLSGKLDSGFFCDITTNRARLKFAYNIEDLNSCVFNKVDSWLNDDMAESYSSRTLTFALGGFLNHYSHYALEFTLHEFGHRGRDIATGESFEWFDRSEVPHLFYFRHC